MLLNCFPNYITWTDRTAAWIVFAGDVLSSDMYYGLYINITLMSGAGGCRGLWVSTFSLNISMTNLASTFFKPAEFLNSDIFS